MNENKLILKKLLLKYDYLESYLEEVNFKYAKYNTQFLKEYYELNPPPKKQIHLHPKKNLIMMNLTRKRKVLKNLNKMIMKKHLTMKNQRKNIKRKMMKI